MLLAQIKANYSSGDDFSSDEETQEDETEDSDDDREFAQGKDIGTDENGKYIHIYIYILNSTFLNFYLYIFTNNKNCCSGVN